MASFFKHGAPGRTGRRAGPLATTVLLAGLALAGAPSRAAEPKVPPAPAPDGVAVAILGPGVDYRAPSLVRRLARDGEGDLISWDFADADNRPFEAPPADAGTRFAQDLAAAAGGATLVIVRERPGDPQAFGHMMSFVAKTPARIVVWPSAAPDRPDWAILLEAAGHFKTHLFIVPKRVRAPTAPFARLASATNVVLVDISDAPDANPAAPGPLVAAAAAAAAATAAAPDRPVAEIAAQVRHAASNRQGARQPAAVTNPPR